MAWTTITSEGGLFPPDLLDELAAGTGDGQREDDFGLERGRPPQGGRSPHALVQEFLNRDEALWGVATNGYRLRLLRDSQRMTRPTFLEFDLEGMITGSQYAEFALLYRLLFLMVAEEQGLLFSGDPTEQLSWKSSVLRCLPGGVVLEDGVEDDE